MLIIEAFTFLVPAVPKALQDALKIADATHLSYGQADRQPIEEVYVHPSLLKVAESCH